MALPSRQRRNPRALTASAVRVNGRDSTTETGRRMEMAWQERALTYLDLVPELGYASRFYARMLKQLRIYPAYRDSSGSLTEIKEGPPVALLERIQDPGGGRSTIQGQFGRLMFATGEGYLFGHDLDTEDERWRFVWTQELTIKDGIITWKAQENTTGKEYREGETAQAYRVWSPHPRRSGEADSPMRSAVEGGIAEELIVLTKAVRATALSRMLNGLLIMPQEISPGPIEPVGDEDPENDPFLADFIDHVSAQIENPGSAEARLPFLAWASYEYLDRIRKIDLHDPQTDYMERELRKEAVDRLARGLDMPVEVLLGLGEANHWAARQIMDDTWRSHGSGVAEQWCDDLNEAYLRPALKEEDFARWKDVVIGMDPSQILARPDRSEDANAAFDRGAIGYSAYRRELNFKEDDAQSEKEHEEFIALKLRDPALLEGTDNLVPGERGPQRAPSQPAADPSQGPPEPGPDGVSRRERMSARILGAAELSLLRCRELAGSRLRRYERECKECLQPAAGKPAALVAALIGDSTITALGTTPRQLVRDGSAQLLVLLKEWGVEELEAQLICSLIEEHAAKTLTTAAVGLPDDLIQTLTVRQKVAA